VIGDLDRGKVVRRVGAPKVHCERRSCYGFGVMTAAWSASGHRLAYSVDTGDAKAGVYALDLRTGRTRRVSTTTSWHLRFDRRDRLVYLTGRGTDGARFGVSAWREAEPKPLVKLRDRAAPKTGQYAQKSILGDGFVLTVVRARTRVGLRLASVWRTDLATGRSRRLSIPAGARDVALAPSSDRVCYFAAKELGCLDLTTGKTAAIARGDLRCGFNDTGRAAWSPSGQRLAFRQCRDGLRDIGVHDFATGKTRTVARRVRYGEVAFQTEAFLLLLHRKLDPRWDYLHAVVSRVDLATGARYALVVDRTSYPYAFPSPGRADRLYLQRDRGGTTDTAWVDTSQPIGPARPTTRPRDGRSIEYQANGNPFRIDTYRGGVLDGPIAWYDWNGMRIEVGQYAAGKRRGDWTRWRPDGRIDKIQRFEGPPGGGTKQTTLCWYRWPEERRCKPRRASYWRGARRYD
jgi:hypothetical protein